MKKIVLLIIGVIGLSSCTMFPNDRSTQQIFYGEPLVKTGPADPNKDLNNTSFIYDPERSDEQRIDNNN